MHGGMITLQPFALKRSHAFFSALAFAASTAAAPPFAIPCEQLSKQLVENAIPTQSAVVVHVLLASMARETSSRASFAIASQSCSLSFASLPHARSRIEGTAIAATAKARSALIIERER